MIRIGDLHRDQREELYNLHAMFVDPDATEAGFYREAVPLVTIDLTESDNDLLYAMPADAVERYAAALTREDTRYPVVADGELIDGLHRITAAITKGQSALTGLDFSGLIDPALSGGQFNIAYQGKDERYAPIP